jgi:hypothetical protein
MFVTSFNADRDHILSRTSHFCAVRYVLYISVRQRASRAIFLFYFCKHSKNYCGTGCDHVYSFRYLSTFRRNVLPPYCNRSLFVVAICYRFPVVAPLVTLLVPRMMGRDCGRHLPWAPAVSTIVTTNFCGCLREGC